MKLSEILNKTKFLCIALMLVLQLTGIQAQEIVTTTGSNASSSDGSVSYSIGQVFYTISNGANGSVSSGVQQPYEISVVSGIEQAKGINLICLAYPNPTTDFLTLNVKNYVNGNLSFQLFDISGKLLENKKIEGSETTISMTSFVSSTYFLKIFDNQKDVKTFKIIKN